jgi:uncharacterized cupin superfamily protein
MNTIVVESQPTPQRLSELGVPAWPLWKDPVGDHNQHYDAEERSYLLDGEAVLTLSGQEPVAVSKGDLVIIPAGNCLWQVLRPVRRHYRSDALSPACCIV